MTPTTETTFQKLFLPYLIYIGLFIGTGFLSGSIVHFPMNPARFSIIGVIGALIFTVCSTLNEKLYNKENYQKEGMVKIIIFSLILSLGIGMISGAIQHFDEEPLYASYLIPLGIFVSLLGYVLKNTIRFPLKKSLAMIGITIATLTLLGFSLHTFAHNYESTTHDQTDHHHAD
jgi:drug/metabolite transporter (DMT)-like permease